MKLYDELDVVTAIVCDDSRREWNGKDILIGVYGSAIKFESIPSFLVCHLWLEIEVTKVNKYEMYLRVIDNSGQTVFQPPSPAQLNVPEVGFSNISVPGIALQVNSTGKLQFQLSSNAENWITVRTLNVISGPIKPIGA